MRKPKTSDLIDAIHRSKGNLSQVARMFDAPRSTVQGWVAKMPGAAQALEDARETRVDLAEYVVYKAMAEETLQAAFYVLNNDPRAKKRGWGPRQEVTGGDGGPVQVRLTWGDDADA